MEIPTQPGHHLAKLAVFHQLHCLVSSIDLSRHFDRNMTDMKRQDKIRRYVHNDHYKMDDSNSSVSTIDHIGE